MWLIGFMYTIPIIDKLGGREAVAEALKRTHKGRSATVTRHALNMWISRNSIPGFAVVQMLELARIQEIDVGPNDFKRRGKSRRQPKRGTIHAE